MSTLTAHGVSVSFGALAVLHNADLAVAPGDRIAVVGPNGVGKSTLLRVLAGLIQPDAGTVSAAGTVGYLPQERDRRDDETAMEYIARRTGVAAAEAAMLAASDRLARASDASEQRPAGPPSGPRAGPPGGPARPTRRRSTPTWRSAVPTWRSGPASWRRAWACPADLDRPAAGLSGGQAARLALAAVLLARFDVLLLDEPTNDLDLAGLDLLESHLAAFRGGLVVVSHDRAFLERTARQVLQIDPHTREVKLYGGGYQAYQDELERDRARAAEAYETYAATRDELIERARRQKEWARSGERSAKSAAARRKEPDKNIRRGRVEGAQHQAARGAATLRAAERLEPVAEPRKEWELRLRFGAAERSGDIVAVLSDAVVRRGAFQLGPVSMQLELGRADAGPGRQRLGQDDAAAGAARPDTARRRPRLARRLGPGRRDRPGQADLRPLTPGCWTRSARNPAWSSRTPARCWRSSGSAPTTSVARSPGSRRASGPVPTWPCSCTRAPTCWSSTSRRTTWTCPRSSSLSRHSTATTERC